MLDQGGARIAVDAMGSDKGPAEMVAAVKLALEAFPQLLPITLVGRQDTLQPLLQQQGLSSHPKLAIHHASEVIEMDDKPKAALRQKRDASMLRGIELVKDGAAKVLVSCGNTGCLMGAGFIKLRAMEGIERPALATIMPRKRGHFVLIDAGANPVAKPENLVHNAVLGSNYCQVVLGIPSPRVALMTIGTEEGKGTELTLQAHELLKRIQHVVNYAGPMEGFQLFEDSDQGIDVVVCDGFTGNVLLKACESLFGLLKSFVSEEIRKNPMRVAGYYLAKGAFDAIKQQVRPERYGGAPLLGLRGHILKAHGSSNRESVMNAIRIANEIVSQDLNRQICSDIERANCAIFDTSR